MLTERDGQIVAWIGRIGPVGVEHVAGRFEMSDRTAYRRLKSLTGEGMLEHHMLLYQRPGLYTATRKALRWQGLERLSPSKICAGDYEHAWQVARAATGLHQALPDWDVVGEREIRAIEIEDKDLFASVQIAKYADRQVLHLPDLALTLPGRGVVPIEVELSVKSKPLLTKICRGWARARHIDRVYYLATPKTARAVKRAASAVNATDRVRVLALDDIPTLAADMCDHPAGTHDVERYI
jgi:hypothetical protein